MNSEPDPPDSGRGPGRSSGDGGEPQDLAELSDHELIEAARAGHEWGFRTLVQRHQARAYRVARQMIPDAGDAMDVSQEAFLRVFRSLDRFDPKHEFSTWLYRIVSNLAIDHLRKRRPVATGGSEDGDEARPETPDDSVPDPSAGVEQEETIARVRACIEALPPHFRSVLALRELEGLPCTEIARIVDATHVTVRWRLHRARKLFQEEWERRERMGAALPMLEDSHASGPDAVHTAGPPYGTSAEPEETQDGPA